MRSECILCGASFATVERAPLHRQDQHGRPLPSRKSWCVGCDRFDAAVVVRRLLKRKQYRRTVSDPVKKARLFAQIAQHKQSPRAQADRRQRNRTPLTQRTFACIGCRGRFAKQREAWRRVDGARVALGMCAFCAEQHHGPSRHEPRDRRALQRAASAPETSLAARSMTHFGDTGAARALPPQ